MQAKVAGQLDQSASEDLTGTSAIFSCSGMPGQVSLGLAQSKEASKPQLTLRSLAQRHYLHVRRA